MTNEPHRNFPYQKGIVESTKTKEKPKSEHYFMLTGEN